MDSFAPPGESFNSDLKSEIAANAARLIAQEGLDYAAAKKKAVKQMGLANRRVQLPDNDEVMLELRLYQELYQSGTQPAELAALRSLALQWMDKLARFSPLLAGAVWNGTANAHSPVHLLLFAPDVKALEFELMNIDPAIEPTEVAHISKPGTVGAMVAQDGGVPIVLALYGQEEARGLLNRQTSLGESAFGTSAQLRGKMAAAP
jgi:ABC-type cobalamin transport system ATPase subunit